jgi:hypothetical protein
MLHYPRPATVIRATDSDSDSESDQYHHDDMIVLGFTEQSLSRHVRRASPPRPAVPR